MCTCGLAGARRLTSFSAQSLIHARPSICRFAALGPFSRIAFHHYIIQPIAKFALLFSSGNTFLVEVYIVSTETTYITTDRSDCYTLLALSPLRYHSGTAAARRLLLNSILNNACRCEPGSELIIRLQTALLLRTLVQGHAFGSTFKGSAHSNGTL